MKSRIRKNIRFTRIITFYVFWIILTVNAIAAPLSFEPLLIRLPDGTSLNLFVSGDEFFNWVHDNNGFPVGEGSDGFYYYLIQNRDDFVISQYRVGSINPFLITGIKKVTIPSYVQSRRNEFQKHIDESTALKGVKSYNKQAGQFNNLVIYIRFLNEPEFTVQRSVYESKLNSLTGSSLRNYYREISYNKLDVVSYHMPGGSTSNIYYTDPNLRSFYQPYNASTNISGYKNDTERTTREHILLANAINWITGNYLLPEGVNFDVNNDGFFDNICFIVRGSPDGWNNLLWPHRWVLYSQDVKIGNLKVNGYTLQLENVSVTTFSHEMFHALGAPDLYHYNNSENPVGPWDIMASGGGHPGAWMKFKYGGWIESIKELKESGTYVIKSLAQGKDNSYLVKSPYRDDQFFVLEYRKKTGTYESSVPASGLIIERIDNNYRGNANGPPDEVYIFRKDGGSGIAGDINSAAFSDKYGRVSFNDNSNPFAFFKDGSKTGINISNIISQGDSMLFTINLDRPVDFTAIPDEDTKMKLSWKCVGNRNFIVAMSTTSEILSPLEGVSYNPGDRIGGSGIIIQNGPSKDITESGLDSDMPYFFTVWAVVDNNRMAYSLPATANNRTGIYAVHELPYEENFDNISSELPRGWKSASGTSGWQLDNLNPFSPPNSTLLNPAQTTDDWFFTPGFDLLSSEKYMITFRYRNRVPSVRETLYLNGGEDRHNNGMYSLPLFTAKNFDLHEFTLHKSVFRPWNSQTYYFGFKTESEGQGVLIDDFRIEKVPLNTTEHSSPEEFYPNPTSGKIIIPATSDTEIQVFRADGTLALRMKIENMQEIDLSFLGSGIFIIKFTSGDKTVTRKVIIL